MSAGRGEVWLVDFGGPAGQEEAGVRPAVIVSADRLNESGAGVVIVVPCTTTHRGLLSEVELDPRQSGLDDVSYAKGEDVKSVSERRLVTRLGSVGPDTMFEIARVLRFLLDL